MSATVSIEIPREIIRSSRMTPQELKQDLAILLFQQGKLSFGKAREMAGMTVWVCQQVGRESAHYFGLHYIGLIGVLTEAKHKGLISTVRPYLDALRDRAGFRLATALYERVLRDQGES